MTGVLLRLISHRIVYLVFAPIVLSGLAITALDPNSLEDLGAWFDAWQAWLIGAVLLTSIALGGGRHDTGAVELHPFTPRYSRLAMTGMIMAGALLALAPFGLLAPSDRQYVSFTANLLAQLCFAILVLLAYRAVVIITAGALRWTLARFAFGRTFASRCTPTIVALFPWLIVVAATLSGYVDLSPFAVGAAAILVSLLLGAAHLAKVSLRTILSHLGPLSVVAVMFQEVTGVGVDTITRVGTWSPIAFYSDAEWNGIFVCALVGMGATLALTLKRNLVSEPRDGTAPASLSIYPDSRNYVGDDGYLDRLCRLILQSDGGVIGVTGLRGAGKSALLGAVMDRFRGERCVVWTVAPVSYQSDDKLSFLMSISRALCQKAIDEAGGVLYGHRSETQRAVEEFIRSVRVPVAVGGLVLAVGYLLGGQTSVSGPLLGPPLSMPDSIQLQDEQIVLTSDDIAVLEKPFEEARAAEVGRLSALLEQIDAALPADPTDNSDRYAIAPIPGEPGFDVVAGSIDHFDVSVLVDRGAWLRRDVELDTSLTEDPIVVPYSFPSPFADIDPRPRPLDLHGLPTPEARRAFALLQEEFERHVVGNRNRLGISLGLPDFERRLTALAALRGDPRLAPHLEGVSAELRQVLRIGPQGAASRGLISPDWASIALIANFYDAVAILENAQSIEEAKEAALDRLFLDDDRLRKLQAVLARYIGILEGRTLHPAATGTTAAAGMAPGLFSVQNIAARTSALPDVRYAWVFGALLLACLLPEIWRAGNFVARGLLNFRVLVLMRACTEFMELLNYSEGREASAGFGFRGLTLAGKRTLSARNLTLQSLTDRYQGFVSLLLTFYNGKLIVIIDELDKMSDPLHVKSVLLELKGALFQRGCYYLISISEDAAAAFRNRMSEGRDIFESTFEDVLGIERMSAGAARAMVHRRLADDPESAVRIDDQAIGILRVFAGAIPREIVRHLRETVLAAADGRSVEPRMIGLDIFRSELLQWRELLKGAPLPGTDLIRLIEITQDIEAVLPAPAAAWPDLSSGSASIGKRLAECLAILDPKQSFMQEVYDFHAVETQSAEHQERYRRLAEIQSCLRLMTMNELMRHVWRTGGLDAEQSEAAVTCLRAIMIQPAVAARLLEDLAVKVLGLDYPEPPLAPKPGAAPATLVIAIDSSASTSNGA